jgi:hypothetical protein
MVLLKLQPEKRCVFEEIVTVVPVRFGRVMVDPKVLLEFVGKFAMVNPSAVPLLNEKGMVLIVQMA